VPPLLPPRRSSQARARVPSSEQSRIYDIGFYHRDPRTRLERERSITLEDAKLLHSARLEGKSTEEGIEAVMGHMAGTKRVMHPRLVDRVKDDDMIYDGSAGRKDPDVNRYSKDGLRSAMTTSWEATDKALWRERPDHTDRFAWQGDPSAVDRAIKASRRRSAYLGKEVAPMMERMPLKNVDGKRWQYYGRFV